MGLTRLFDSTAPSVRKILAAALLVTGLIAAGLFYATRLYILNQAENKIEDLLLAHKGIHQYIQQVMHPALYRYKDAGRMDEDFYAPELFSSSFIIRNQHIFYNQERTRTDLPELYYKLAASNPRNIVNKADPMESDLIALFSRDRSLKKHSEILTIDSRKFLYVALPFLENQPQCMVCHGKREDSPKDLQERYPGEGGFNEKVGDIRAIISVRAPLDREIFTAYIIFSALLSGGLVIVFLFFFNDRLRSIVKKRTQTLEHEVAERRHAEKKLEEMNVELRSKNKELEQVVYVASHDLRSPLVNVQGFSRELALDFKELSTLLERTDIPGDLKASLAPIVVESVPQSIDFISKSIAKMDSLLSGLLKISRLGRSSMNVVRLDMNDLLLDVVANYEFQLKTKGIALKIDRLPDCLGDAIQINQVFSNLVGNAIKFSDPKKQGQITITGRLEEEKAVYCVEDNGIGIEKGHQPKIFEIFHQLNPDSEGQGLGLNIVSKILDRHDGKVWVESEPGQYSRFYLALPKSRMEAPNAPGAPPS
ncbi:MAG: DUF3365 domain-containing protein [Pseudomonadota bacterium]